MLRKNRAFVLLSTFVLIGVFFTLVSEGQGQAQAAPQFQVTLTASLQGYTSQSIIGAATDATSGFDVNYDAVAPPIPAVGVYSYLYYPNNPLTPVDFRKLSTSIIPQSSNMNWTLRVQTSGLTGNVVLSWTPLPATYSGYIKDTSGSVMLADMAKSAQYSYPAQDTVTITFILNLEIPEYPSSMMIVLGACLTSAVVLKISKRHLPKRNFFHHSRSERIS